MAPRNLVSQNIEVDKTETVETFRQHIHVTDQASVPQIVSDIAMNLAQGKATGEFTVRFNQGGCRAIFTEQVTREVVREHKD